MAREIDDEVRGWFAGRVASGWFTEAPEVAGDREEVLVTGRLAEPVYEEGSSEAARGAARAARIQAFREETRRERMRIADEAERRFGRKVAWAVRCGEDERSFTALALPVMTRLRLSERAVLDTLVDAGVARSRSEALAWSVRLVGRHQSEWIGQLREALSHVEKVRSEGPGAKA
jgi:hypothetical protein